MFHSFSIASSLLSTIAFIHVLRMKNAAHRFASKIFILLLIQFNILNIIEYFYVERVLSSLSDEFRVGVRSWVVYINLIINFCMVCWYSLFGIDLMIIVYRKNVNGYLSRV